MKRIRARRGTLLLVSAIPLVAIRENVRLEAWASSSAVSHGTLREDAINFADEYFGRHYNIVVPFRWGFPHDHMNITSTSPTAKHITEAETSKEGATTPDAKLSEALDDPPVDDTSGDELKRVVVDYASKSAGALILESSTQWNGISNILNSDRDKYAIIPCSEPKKAVVMGLSEDIQVKDVVIANYERYSSHIRDVHIFGSQTMTAQGGSWVPVGKFELPPGNGKHAFNLKTAVWARYLKFHFLSHYGDEHYCTISQISVHGNTVLQGFHEEIWATEEEEEPDKQATPEIGSLVVPPDSSQLQDDADVPNSECPQNGPCCLESPRFSNTCQIQEGFPEVALQPLITGVSAEESTSTTVKPVVTSESKDVHVVKDEEANSSVLQSGGDDDSPVVQETQLDLTEVQTVQSQNREHDESDMKDDNAEVVEELSSNEIVILDNPEIEARMQDFMKPLEMMVERFPSASCLSELDLSLFKAARQPLNTNANTQTAQGMEPIFKKLTDEIKTLQNNVAVLDKFAQETSLCYQHVLVDVILEMDKDRRQSELRLKTLEKNSQSRLFALLGAIVSTFIAGIVSLKPLLLHIPAFQRESSQNTVIEVACAVLSFVILFCVVRRRRPRPKSRMIRRDSDLSSLPTLLSKQSQPGQPLAVVSPAVTPPGSREGSPIPPSQRRVEALYN